MDIILIFNGLGNQMSQYAFYLQKCKINKNTKFIFDTRSTLRHNGFELERVFGINYRHGCLEKFLLFVYKLQFTQKFKSFLPYRRILKKIQVNFFEERNDYTYDEGNFIERKGLNFYYGGWHSEKNFSGVSSQISKAFKFQVTDAKNLTLLKQIEEVNSVSIHIRKGDYMNDENYLIYGAVCSRGYFEKAIRKILELVENPKFFIFTNDIDWVEKNINLVDYKIVSHNKGQDSWKDMFLMSNCKSNINSNSSFSWWASYLNKKKDKIVITPYEFVYRCETPDIYPEEWIKIDNYTYDH